jgi:nucleotide-binding universal stress UspA family protein
MYSRILVAVDGSPHSEHALKHATALAKGLAASLRIVHVVDMGWLPIGPEIAIDIEPFARARRTAGERTLALARETTRSAGLEAETSLIETVRPTQRTSDAIAEEAVTWLADLVVVGTHGRSGVERLLLGSVAEGVARLSSAPVLLVPLSRPPHA